jgi:hypothetical protein
MIVMDIQLLRVTVLAAGVNCLLHSVFPLWFYIVNGYTLGTQLFDWINPEAMTS